MRIGGAEEELQRATGMLERMRQQEVSEGVRSSEECTWRLKPKGEREVPNIIIQSGAVGGTKVDPDGEGHGMKRMKYIQKKETPERSRLGGNEKRRKGIEAHLAEWIGMEHREEAHEKAERHV